MHICVCTYPVWSCRAILVDLGAPADDGDNVVDLVWTVILDDAGGVCEIKFTVS